MSQQNTSYSDAEQHPVQTIKKSTIAKPTRLRGLIQRGLDELERNGSCDWLQRTSKLKFQRVENKA